MNVKCFLTLVSIIVACLGSESWAAELAEPCSMCNVDSSGGATFSGTSFTIGDGDCMSDTDWADELVFDKEDGCDAYCEPEPIKLFPEIAGVQIGGWTQIGGHNQSTGMFNSIPDKLNLHQQWLYAEKVADGQCGWDWGFRADLMYGTDANDTQAFGNNPGMWDFLNGWGDDDGDYGLAMPQLYVEVANGDLSIKAGHFYTLVGYEVVTAPDNFFYSHAFTMYNSEPFTHTGLVATYGVSDKLEVYGGWTLGWDTGFDQFEDGNSFLGGLSYSFTDDIALTYITTMGNLGWRGDGYSHSLVLDITLTEKLNYVLQSDMVSTSGSFLTEHDLFLENIGNDDIGINQYLFYDLNDCWGLGARVEWWKQDGVSVNETTFGVNWKPHTNLVMRPEIRHQWAPAANYDETIFGVDAVLTY